jgi:wingless-type MMTV integration site family protein 4
MKQVCKCHGVSGSCSMKICWQVMPDFRVIGDSLIKTFNKASQVSIDRQKMILRVTRKAIKKSEYPNQIRNPNKDDLVYVGRSLNFCEKNPNVGSMGTKGRKCILIPKALMLSNSSSPNSDINPLTESCSHLCCGRGYRTKIVELEEDCNCQFQWCCHVKCDKCKKRIIEYYCN